LFSPLCFLALVFFLAIKSTTHDCCPRQACVCQLLLAFGSFWQRISLSWWGRRAGGGRARPPRTCL
jgi:hypothetical protein